MSFRKLFNISAFAGMAAAGLIGWTVAASGGSPEPAERQTWFLPLQGISHEFGSKFMSGYFVEQEGHCFVNIMIIERIDPDNPSPMTAARVRLMLDPRQVAGIDSEEGRSVNLTCGESAATLLVDYGHRDRLVALQTRARESELARAAAENARERTR